MFCHFTNLYATSTLRCCSGAERARRAMFSETWRQWTMFSLSQDDILQQTGRQLNIQGDRHSNKQIGRFYITGVFNRLFKTFISHNCSCPLLFSFFLHLPLSPSLVSLLSPLIFAIVHPSLRAFTPALLAFAFVLPSQSIYSPFFPKIKATSRLRSVTS